MAVKNKLSSAIVCFVKAFQHLNVCPAIKYLLCQSYPQNPLSRSFIIFNSIFDGKGGS